MTTNKFSKYVIDNIVVGTPISSIIAAGATIGLDSAAVIDLIDSDYIQQRESSGLDSAEVIALIDSDYVAARTLAGLDSAATLDLLSYGIQNVGSNQKQVAISLNTFVDPFDQTGTTDRSFNLNYTSTTGMFVRETGGRTEIHADASGTGQSTGLLLTGASFGNNGTEIAGNLKLSSLPTSDPSESGLLWNDGGIPVFSGSTAPIVSESLDSADVVGIVDSAYVQARQTPQDFAYSSLTGAPTALSSFTNDTNFVDSVGVISAVTSSDLDMGGNKVLFSNVYPTEVDLPDATANHGMFAHVHATGAGYFAHAGSWVQLANDSDIPVGGGGLEGFDVSQYDSATSNGIFEYNVSPGNQLRHLYSLNDAVSPTAYDGSLEHQVSWTISSNQQFGFRDAGAGRTKVNARANGTTATTGLVLEGETFNNSGVELVGNVKLSSLPTSDPSETGLLWNDGGIPVFSGSTAPTGGGGLDSAGVTALINEPYLRDTLYDVATAQTNIGLDAGFASTSNFSIAIGKESGINSGNATNSIALGFKAGQSINDNSIMIGRETGEVGAGSYSVGIGTEALGIGAGAGSVAIGYFASKSSAGSNSVAVGRQTSATGDNAIAIGNTVTATTADAVTIGSSVAGRMTYDTTNDWTFGAGVTMTDLTASGVVIFSALPTADPVNAGQLWNDGGTLKVSAG